MLKPYKKLLAAAIITCAAISSFSVAQAVDETDYAKAFKGRWVSYGAAFSNAGEDCHLDFKATKTGDSFAVTPSNCKGELATIFGWKLVNDQLVFVNSNNEAKATLGGNQFRLSGEFADTKTPFIIEKEDNAKKIMTARKSIKCTYLGYGQKCATPQQYAPPVAKDGEKAQVTILMGLNARTEPRADSNVLGVLQKNTCIRVETCTAASDGLWCKADFGGKAGWFKKQAIRSGKWSVMTFVSGCEAK